MVLLGGVAGEDSRLNGSAVGNGLIGVDALVGLLAVEKVGDELDDTSDTSGASNQDDLADVGLVDFGVTEVVLDFSTGSVVLWKRRLEFFEAGASEGSVEIDPFKERVNFYGSVGG